MCQLKSAIVLKDRVFCPLDYDSHEQMIAELKLDDKSNSPDFVRVEMTPKDGDIFNHSLDNWQLQVDQDFKPEWFSQKFAEEEMKKEIVRWFGERFVINDKTWKKFNNSRIYTKNSSVEAWGNSSVVARENSSVVAWGNSSVEARGNSSVEARENSSVEARENSSVVARENSSVVAWGNSSVEAWGNSSVVAWGNSSVEARGNSQILLPFDYPVKIKGVYDNASVKDIAKNIIILGNPKMKIKRFKAVVEKKK